MMTMTMETTKDNSEIGKDNDNNKFTENNNDDGNDDDDDVLRRDVGGCIWRSSWDNIGRIGRSSK